MAALDATSGSGAASSVTRPNVAALRVSAVTEVSSSTTSTTRPVTTCRRWVSVPRTRPASCRQPPRRRASSTSPLTEISPIASAMPAAAQRPASPSRKLRCRFLNQRIVAEGWTSPSAWPLAGSTRLARAWPLSKA